MLLRLLRGLAERLRGPWAAPDPAEATPPEACAISWSEPPPEPGLLALLRCYHPAPGEVVVQRVAWVDSVETGHAAAPRFGRGVYRVCSERGAQLDCWPVHRRAAGVA